MLDSVLQVIDTISVVLPADNTINDPVPGNTGTSGTGLLDFLPCNGFQSAVINSPSGSQRVAMVLLGRARLQEGAAPAAPLS